MRVDCGGVGLHVDVWGPEEGPAVVLLHGFPDTGRLWTKQVPALTAAGYRVIVPDQRGYGQSDKPADVEAYNLLFLASDVSTVMDAAGVARAHVVGHDWGAAVAWGVASFAADRVDHLAVLSVGHPLSFRDAGLEQREKSWYMLLFQFEGIAEQWLSADNWANLRSWGRHPDVDAVIAELEADGSLTPGLNWYRANVPPRSFVEQQMTGSAAFVSGLWRYERIDGPGHWLQWEAPDRVNTLLLDFFAR
jgi:pimeloyl-ACP methyl ester carboxylesterase